MCFGGGDDGSEQMRADEQARNARIEEGMGSIDKTFAPFNNDYYKIFQNKAYDLNKPDIDTQYNDAYKTATYGLARSGQSRSSAAAKAYGDLEQQRGRVEQTVSDSARSRADALRSSVETSRGNLVAQLNATANPQAAAQAAINQAATLTQPPTYSPITDAFAQFTGQFADQQSARRAGYPGWGFDIFSPSSSSSRSRTQVAG